MRAMLLERSGSEAHGGRSALKDEPLPAVRVRLTCPSCGAEVMQPIEKKKARCYHCSAIWPWERVLRVRAKNEKRGKIG